MEKCGGSSPRGSRRPARVRVLATDHVAATRPVAAADLELRQDRTDLQERSDRRAKRHRRDDRRSDARAVRAQEHALDRYPATERSIEALKGAVLAGEAPGSKHAQRVAVSCHFAQTQLRAYFLRDCVTR